MKLDYSYHYRKWHSDTPEHRLAMVRYYQRILRNHLPLDKAARCLDIGCGMGFAIIALKELGYVSVHGIDCDAGQVAAGRAKGIAIEQVEDSAAFLSTQASHFDVILALDLIEHIAPANQIEFMRALQGALRPGGILICTVPNANSSLASRYQHIDWTHQCSFTEHSLDFLLYHGGFSQIQVMEVEYLERPRYWWLPVAGGRHWWAFRFFRCWRRLEMMAELGPDQGRRVPLSLNLLAVARHPL